MILHRLAFIALFILSLSPNTFAKKELRNFHKKLLGDIEKTKGNEHIYRPDRKPASVDIEYEWQEDVKEADTKTHTWESDHQDLVRDKDKFQNSTGLGQW